MKRFLTSPIPKWMPALFLLSALISANGCKSGHPGRKTGSLLNQRPDMETGALPQPHGTVVKGFQKVQADKAEVDDFVIYVNEWFMGGVELGPFGQSHLEQIGQRWPHVPFPVILQNSGDKKLDQVRRLKVIETLTAAGITDAVQRVRVGSSAALDLDGNEAPRIYRQMLTPPTTPAYNNHYNRSSAPGGSPLGGVGFFGGPGNFFGY